MLVIMQMKKLLQRITRRQLETAAFIRNITRHSTSLPRRSTPSCGRRRVEAAAAFFGDSWTGRPWHQTQNNWRPGIQRHSCPGMEQPAALWRFVFNFTARVPVAPKDQTIQWQLWHNNAMLNMKHSHSDPEVVLRLKHRTDVQRWWWWWWNPE